MSMAQLLITAVVVEGRSKSAVARDYGVTRRWVHTLVTRYEAEGEAAFQPRSRRPRTSPQRTPVEVEDAIVALRKELADAGHDAGAETIAWHLRQRDGHAPSVPTIWRILSRRGFVTPQPHKRPRSSWKRFEATLPNECWQADITHVRLANGREVEILNILDDHSRLLIGSTARTVFTAPDVVTDIAAGMEKHGRPERMLTDNGAVFTAAYRGRSWVALERHLVALGVQLRHSAPYHPQTCGKVERFHQTLKKWLAHQPRARSLIALQAQLEQFTAYYNQQRPHRAVGRRTPAQAYTARPKAGPIQQGLRVSEHFRVRRDRVDPHGKITLRYASQLRHIYVGRAWSGTRVLLLVRDLDIRIITEEGELIREGTLDPDRDYQSLRPKV